MVGVRIEKLTNNKIKVTLTTADLINLNIDVEQLEPDSKELHSFLFHIMETIREETDFNPYSGQVVVEATPSNEGISIMVSRLGGGKKKITKREFKKATSVKPATKKSARTEIFYFDKFNDLCTALSESPEESLIAGCLYRLNDIYCFTIKKESVHNACLSVMSEFSAKKSLFPLQLVYIKEHGELIAKGKKLVDMAEKVKQLM